MIPFRWQECINKKKTLCVLVLKNPNVYVILIDLYRFFLRLSERQRFYYIIIVLSDFKRFAIC